MGNNNAPIAEISDGICNTICSMFEAFYKFYYRLRI